MVASRRGFATLLTAVSAVTVLHARLLAQTDGTCVPIEERAGREFGCFITAREVLGPLSPRPPLYWYLYTYPTLAAARADRGPRGTVVESLGRVWLFTIADTGFHPASGKRVARVGPLPLVRAEQFAATYMEAVFEPGMASVVYRHPGVEAFYTIDGSMCLETPTGRIDQRAGGPGIMVPGDVPMILTGTGKRTRRSVVLILQDASLPRSTPVDDWTPSGVCRTAAR